MTGGGARQGLVLAAIALVAYAWLAPSTIVDGDNAEFVTLGALGGRAHPSGYPSYVLYLRAMSWLPGSAAYATALATCLLSAAAVLVLHAACRAWGARPLAAGVACALYAAAPGVLRTHVEAEVFAGNALVVALVLWLAAAAAPVRGVARAALLGLVAGLGLGNHLTCALVAPVGVLGLVRAAREARAPLALAAGALGLAAGLATYAYLLVADGPASYGRADTLGDVARFFLREDFGGPGAFAPEGEALPAANLGALARTLGRGWLWLPALAGLAVLGLRVARPAGESRVAWATLAASWLLAGPLLVLRFNVAPEGMGRYVVERFHLLPLVLLALPVAAALDRALDRAEATRLDRPVVRWLVPPAVFLALAATSLPRLAATHSPAVARAVTNTLGALPPDAVVIVHTDDLCFGGRHAQLVLGARPDVDVVCWGFLPWDWYQDRLAARGLVLGKATFGADIDAILRRRPVYFSSQDQLRLSSVGRVRPSYPFAGVFRALPYDAPPPALAAIVAENRAAFARFDLAYPRPGPDDDWATVAHQRYVTTWLLLANALRAAGQRELEAEALAIARELYPPAFE